MRVAVIGAGAWGTSLAVILLKNGHEVVLWGHEPENLKRIQIEGQNARYLPGIEIPPQLIFESELPKAVASASVVVLAVPSKAFRETVQQLTRFSGIVVSVTKGIEYETGRTMSALVQECIPNSAITALSGPTLALEVARGIPSAIVAASNDQRTAEQVQELFHRPSFRVYTSTDILGVELGGALKNVVAIAAGVGDGLGFGDNSKAALITRGIAEIRRLGLACGAQAETFSGLSGLGDLTVTCFSKLSRNRTFGERLGRGETVANILETSNSVAEGYPTTRSAWHLSKQLRVTTPIIDEVYATLYEGKDPRQTVMDLTARTSKAED